MKLRSNSGQSTIEFAHIMPIFIACIALIVGVLSACLQVLSLNDFARSAARVAVTADDAHQAVAAMARPSGVSTSVTEQTDGIITVTSSQPFRLWFLTLPIARLQLRASCSMMREPPVVLG